ncbi:hypothetical protein MXE38_06515 [Anaerobiospirillum sp. NML120448]|uniref:hypothetical protein n=1 Tax=Anaerobiospirillum sp. NML120448 TaxID=2932816 RepID=UPI001FF56B89|nr:hypothetical protein [Anaerobiospirillum sp. NML120448]MCK0514505.1 hypothetical protein [Anaerobiospirillum sp. NML120448]
MPESKDYLACEQNREVKGIANNNNLNLAASEQNNCAQIDAYQGSLINHKDNLRSSDLAQINDLCLKELNTSYEDLVGEALAYQSRIISGDLAEVFNSGLIVEHSSCDEELLYIYQRLSQCQNQRISKRMPLEPLLLGSDEALHPMFRRIATLVKVKSARLLQLEALLERNFSACVVSSYLKEQHSAPVANRIVKPSSIEQPQPSEALENSSALQQSSSVSNSSVSSYHSSSASNSSASHGLTGNSPASGSAAVHGVACGSLASSSFAKVEGGFSDAAMAKANDKTKSEAAAKRANQDMELHASNDSYHSNLAQLSNGEQPSFLNSAELPVPSHAMEHKGFSSVVNKVPEDNKAQAPLGLIGDAIAKLQDKHAHVESSKINVDALELDKVINANVLYQDSLGLSEHGAFMGHEDSFINFNQSIERPSLTTKGSFANMSLAPKSKQVQQAQVDLFKHTAGLVGAMVEDNGQSNSAQTNLPKGPVVSLNGVNNAANSYGASGEQLSSNYSAAPEGTNSHAPSNMASAGNIYNPYQVSANPESSFMGAGAGASTLTGVNAGANVGAGASVAAMPQSGFVGSVGVEAGAGTYGLAEGFNDFMPQGIGSYESSFGGGASAIASANAGASASVSAGASTGVSANASAKEVKANGGIGSSNVGTSSVVSLNNKAVDPVAIKANIKTRQDPDVQRARRLKQPVSAFEVLLKTIEQHTGIDVDAVEVDPFEIYQMRRQEANEVANEIKQRQEAFYRQFMSNMRKDANVNPEYTFDRLRKDELNHDAFSLSFKFLASINQKLNKQMLLVFGDRGSGKTLLCHAIANQYMNLKAAAHYQSPRNRQLPLALIVNFDDVKKTWLFLHKETYEEKLSRENLFKTYCEVDLLILDGLCSDNMALEPFSQKVFSELIRTRVAQNLPMVVTTSINLQAIHKAVGDLCYEGIKSFDVDATALLGGSRRPNIRFNGGYLP